MTYTYDILLPSITLRCRGAKARVQRWRYTLDKPFRIHCYWHEVRTPAGEAPYTMEFFAPGGARELPLRRAETYLTDMQQYEEQLRSASCEVLSIRSIRPLLDLAETIFQRHVPRSPS